MASDGNERFAELSDNKLQDLLEIAYANERGNSNTNQVIEASRTIFEDYCNAKGKDFYEISNGELEILADVLQKFYAEMRKKNGEPYCRSSYGSIRYGLQRYFQRTRKIDIVNDSEFKTANEMFKAILLKLRKEGKGEPQHREIITDSDLRKIYNSDVFDTNDPEGLQFKVFFDVLFYTCRRSRDGLRQMMKSDFDLRLDAEGRRYYFYKISKKDGLPLEDIDESARIYENPGNTICPVTSLEKYLAKLNTGCEFFWQRPKIKRNIRIMDKVWFDNAAIGHNLLGKMMRVISERVGLTTMYTNHSIRATYMTRLDHRGYEAVQIMGQLFGGCVQQPDSTMYLQTVPGEWPSPSVDQSSMTIEPQSLSTQLMVNQQKVSTGVVTRRFPLIPATVVRAPANVLHANQQPASTTTNNLIGQAQVASVSTFKQVVSATSSHTAPSVVTIHQPVTSIPLPNNSSLSSTSSCAVSRSQSDPSVHVVPQSLIRVTSPRTIQLSQSQMADSTPSTRIKLEPVDDFVMEPPPYKLPVVSPAICTSTTFTQTDGFWASPEDVLNLMSEIFSLKRKINELTNENERLKNSRYTQNCENDELVRRQSGLQVVSAEVYNDDGSHAYSTML